MPIITSIGRSDISLFHLAARYMNDATQWYIIAQTNGITDPLLNGPILSVTIPDANPLLTGGVPIQAA